MEKKSLVDRIHKEIAETLDYPSSHAARMYAAKIILESLFDETALSDMEKQLIGEGVIVAIQWYDTDQERAETIARLIDSAFAAAEAENEECNEHFAEKLAE